MHNTNPRLGISFMIAAMMFNATKDGIAKMLAASYTPLTILLIQFTVTSLILAPMVIQKNGARALLPDRWFGQIIRSAFVTVGVGLYYWAINFIHIADATAMVFVAPLLVTALSPWVLGEPLGSRRIIAVAIGFLGVLVILRPTMEGDRTGYFIALISGVFLAAFYMSNRKLADSTPILASAFYTSFIGMILLIPFLSFYWVMPKMDDVTILLSFASLATIGQILMVGSFSFAAANIIAPFVYTQIIWATSVGYVLFGALPDQWSWTGIAIVAATGVYIAIREIKIKEN
ncbi:MAG: DMT family transporter [Rhodospirillaceae bacterium]|nr:DMT family transporter [Rhodospirillaceae bacterium]